MSGQTPPIAKPSHSGHPSAVPTFQPGWRGGLRTAFLLLACALPLYPLWPAPHLTATLNRSVVPVGEEVVLSLTFHEAAPPTPPPLPPLSKLRVLSVGQSRSIEFVNNQTSMKVTFNYTLTPTEVGEIAVPTLSVTVGGQVLTTPPLALRAVRSQLPPGTEAGRTNSAFLTLNAAKEQIYFGEALPVEISLYVVQGQGPQMPQLIGEGFTVGPMEQPGQNRVRVGNQVFTIVPFKTFVTAARSGTLTLGPATMSLEIPGPSARRDFFGTITGWIRVNLASNTKTIRVLPLPTNDVPASFTGAVGAFNLSVTASPPTSMSGIPSPSTSALLEAACWKGSFHHPSRNGASSRPTPQPHHPGRRWPWAQRRQSFRASGHSSKP